MCRNHCLSLFLSFILFIRSNDHVYWLYTSTTLIQAQLWYKQHDCYDNINYSYNIVLISFITHSSSQFTPLLWHSLIIICSCLSHLLGQVCMVLISFVIVLLHVCFKHSFHHFCHHLPSCTPLILLIYITNSDIISASIMIVTKLEGPSWYVWSKVKLCRGSLPFLFANLKNFLLACSITTRIALVWTLRVSFLSYPIFFPPNFFFLASFGDLLSLEGCSSFAFPCYSLCFFYILFIIWGCHNQY